MDIFTFAPLFALGSVVFQHSMDRIDPSWILLGLLVTWLSHRLLPSLRWLSAIVLGFAWAWGAAQWAMQEVFPAAWEGLDLVVEGRIAGLPDSRGERHRFILEPSRLTLHGRNIAYAGRIRLAWYRTASAPRAGEQWRLRVRLKAAHGLSNPGSFDYEGWLFQQGIRATGYVRQSADNQRLRKAAAGIDAFRQAFRERLEGIGDTPAMGVILALTLGDRGRIDRHSRRVFTRTGTNHLIAISGLHIGIIAGLAYFLARAGWRQSAFLCRRVAADRGAAVAGLLAAAGYAALAGFSISTQRALLMLSVVFLALLWGRTLRPWGGLLGALLLVLLVQPGASISSGFWLSFGAVAILLYSLGGRLGPAGRLRRLGRAQWAVSLGLLPLLLPLFGQASAVGPLVNMLAVPLFGVLILPAVLLATLLSMLSGWAWPLAAAGELLDHSLAMLGSVADLSWAAWTLPQRPHWVWLSALLGVIVLLSPKGVPGKAAGALMLLPALLLQPPRPASGAFHFMLLDVGQGLAAVVRTRDHVLVFDTGPLFKSGFNTGSAVLVPYLRSLGLRRLDYLIVSHADQDHAGGVRGLLREIPADAVISGEPSALGPLADASLCTAGTRWRWNGVDFRILHPDEPLPNSGNNRSCVLRVENAAGALLLTGDAEQTVERDLLSAPGVRLKSRVLVAGHHGSNTSSSDAFLARVGPEFVLYSAGYRNRYGFPKPQVRQRVRRTGAREYATPGSGALGFEFGADGTLRGPSGQRREGRRYWTHKPRF